jgi:hypothetical protein
LRPGLDANILNRPRSLNVDIPIGSRSVRIRLPGNILANLSLAVRLR